MSLPPKAEDNNQAAEVPLLTPGGGQRSARAVGFSLAARAARSLGRLLAFWFAARIFSLSDLGSFAAWTAAGSLAAVVSDFGVSEHLVRSLAARAGERHQLTERALRMRMVVLPVALLVASAFGALLLGRPSWASLGALAFGLGTGLVDFLAALRRAAGRFDLEALESGLTVAVVAACALVVWALGLSYSGLCLLLGLSILLGVLARMLLLLWQVSPDRRVLRKPDFGIARDSLWLWLKQLSSWVYLDATALLLTHFGSREEAGLFAIAARVVGLMTQPLTAITSVFTPAMAYAVHGNRSRYLELVERLNRITMSLVPAGISFCAVAQATLFHVQNREPQEVQAVVLLLALAYAVNFGVVNSAPLYVIRQERADVTVALLGQVAQIVLLVLLAPSRGALGGALSVLVSLLLARTGVALIYRRQGLPVISRFRVEAACFIGIWLGMLAFFAGTARISVLLAGGLVSVAVTFHLLRTTRVFA